MQYIRILPLMSLISALAFGCSPQDEKVFKGAGNSETKPVATSLQDIVGVGADQVADAKEAATVTYVIKVTGNSGASLCAGEATIVIMTDFSMTFPTASIQCVSLTIDLAGILGANAGATAGAAGEDDGNLIHDGKVLSIRTIANATFDPPRPFLLGPIVQDAGKYKNFKRTTRHTLTGTDSTGAPVSGSGSFTVEVLEEQAEYKNDYLKMPFTNVLHWTMSTSGFNDIPATTGLIFEKWEWSWNTRPIMIPGITIEGRLGDFIKSTDSGAQDALLGRVQIKLLVKDYDFHDGADLN